MSKPIKLMTDSTSDLPEGMAEELNIKIIPLLVVFKDESYKDGEEINTEGLYKKVSETGELPKTSAATVQSFYDAFKEYTKQGYDIIYTGLGSKFSATYQNAMAAKNQGNFENVYLVDSMNLSSSIALILMKMNQFIEMGYSASEIQKKTVLEVVPNVRCSFAIPSMDYLYKGGRCKGITKFFGTILKIKPVISVVNGEMVVAKTPRGSLYKALDCIYEDMESNKEEIDMNFLTITHSINPDGYNYLIPKVKECLPEMKHIYNCSAGCVISSHCGKGTLGILYILKYKEK